MLPRLEVSTMGTPGAAHYSDLPEFISEAFESEMIELVRFELEPGEEYGLHYQNPPMEEYYYILDGRADIHLGDEVIEAEPGTVAFVPPKVPHKIVPSYGEKVTYLVIVSPPTLNHAPDVVWLEDEDETNFDYERIRSDHRPENL